MKGGSSAFPSIYTSANQWIDTKRNCGGSVATIAARRAAPGVFMVRFPGDTSLLATATSNADGSAVASPMTDNTLTVSRVLDNDGLASFRVEIRDVCSGVGCELGTAPQDGQFVLFTY